MTIPCDCHGALEAAERAEREESERRRAEFAAARRDRVTDALSRCGIPKRFMDVAPSDEFLGVVYSGRSLYFAGMPGTYKTTTACATLKAYAYGRETASVRYANVSRLFREIKGTYTKANEDTEKSVMDPLYSCRLLVLDDLGNGDIGAWGLQKLYDVTNDRYDSGMPTIFTSQYDLSELGEMLAALGNERKALSIVRRISEGCDYIDFDERQKSLRPF